MRQFSLSVTTLWANISPLANNDREGSLPILKMPSNCFRKPERLTSEVRQPYWREWPAWYVLPCILAMACSVVSCAGSRDKYKEAERALDYEKDYDKAEPLLLEAAQGTDDWAGRAKRDLVKFYDHKGVMKPDAQKELYWLIKVTQHRSSSSTFDQFPSAGEAALRIGNRYRDGIGAAKDIDEACIWYLKAYQTALRGGFSDMRSSGDSDSRSALSWDSSDYGDSAVNNLNTHCTSMTVSDSGAKQALEKAGKQFQKTQRDEQARKLQKESDERWREYERKQDEKKRELERIQRSRD